MDGFLLVRRYSMDDIPMGLFATLAEAEEFAATQAGRYLATECELLGADPNNSISCMVICEFRQGRFVGTHTPELV